MPSRLTGQVFFYQKIFMKKCSSLYDFCRTIDNIADDKNELNIKKKNLLIFKNDFINKNFDNLIIKNMWILMEENKISIKIVEDLFDGIESDLNEVVKFNKKKRIVNILL